MILGLLDIAALGLLLLTIDGLVLDEGLCETDGSKVSERVGDALGSREGKTDTLGTELGNFEGFEDRLLDGDVLADTLGVAEGMVLGVLDITILGTTLSSIDGLDDGLCETDGSKVSTRVGDALGSREGNTDTLGTVLGKYKEVRG